MSETETKNLDNDAEDTFENISSQLDRGEKNKVLQTNYNCQLVLRKDPLFTNAIRFNELNQKVDICQNLGWKRDSVYLCDTDLDNIITYGLRTDKQIERAIRVVAKENSYHPIREKLMSLEWDGVERLPYALHHFLGVEKTSLSVASLKVFMLGAIARVFKPGCKFDICSAL